MTTLDTTVARTVAKVRSMPRRHLANLAALLGEGLRLDVTATTLYEMSTFVDALTYHGYQTTYTIVDGAYVVRLVDYRQMPAQLTPALSERLTYVGQGKGPLRLTRDEWDGVNKRSVCWKVAQWAQTASAAEIACLAALLTSCPGIPVGQLLETSTAVAA